MDLVSVIQELSLARSIDRITAIVRKAARALTNADGATFVLRDDGKCFYADEDAIAPLWKGLRFPMEACVSGWSMLNKQRVVIPDIYDDARVPADAYKPTFVKSLAMVPIRQSEPIGAIGVYWAKHHQPSEDDLKQLQALADSTSIAMENVDLVQSLERRVQERTKELEAANAELKAFSSAVSHDLRAPVRSMLGFISALEEDAGDKLDEDSKKHIVRVKNAAGRMNELIDAMLGLSQVTSAQVTPRMIDVSALAGEVFAELRSNDATRDVKTVVQPGMEAKGDVRLVRILLTNLLSNAWKFTGKKPGATIEVGTKDGEIFVSDDGAGFDMTYAHKLFAPFQRLCTPNEFPGTGIGLATAARVVRRHGGEIRAEGHVGKGATFAFTLPG